MTDHEQEIGQFIYDRLVHVHGENKNYDYMHKFKAMLNEHPKLKRVRDAAIEYHWLEGRQVCLDKQYGVPCSLCTALVNTQDSS